MTARKKHAHYSYCGAPFAGGAAWPRTCTSCSTVSYLNPTPVGVVLLPVDDGILHHHSDQTGARQVAFSELGIGQVLVFECRHTGQYPPAR